MVVFFPCSIVMLTAHWCLGVKGMWEHPSSTTVVHRRSSYVTPTEKWDAATNLHGFTLEHWLCQKENLVRSSWKTKNLHSPFSKEKILINHSCFRLLRVGSYGRHIWRAGEMKLNTWPLTDPNTFAKCTGVRSMILCNWKYSRWLCSSASQVWSGWTDGKKACVLRLARWEVELELIILFTD